MRRALLVLLFLPLASAAWTDDAADQQIGYAPFYQDGEPQYQWIDAGGQGWYPNVDITGASISETATDLVFTIETTSNDATPPPSAAAVGVATFDDFVHGFRFSFNGEPYVVVFVYDWEAEDIVIAQGYGFDIFGSTFYYPWGETAPATPLDAGGWTGSLPKDSFRDAELVPLREGDVLEDIEVFAGDNEIFGGGVNVGLCPAVSTQDPGRAGTEFCGWTLADEAPDLGSYTVLQTPPGVGHMFMRLEAPYRLSNGLATTYLFEADLRNLEDIEDTVALQVSDIPKGWEVRLPSSAAFSGEGQQTVPIAVTVPFSHVHGDSQIMTLSAISQRNASAIVEDRFGVIFADPPQPAGHHDTLHFFGKDSCADAGFSCPDAYMNAGSEPLDWMGRAADADEVSGWPRYYDRSDVASIDQPAVREWWIDLRPGLGIGLDFDVSETGTLSMDMRFDEAWDAHVDADLVLYSWDDGYTFTHLAGGALDASFAADQAQTVEIPLTIDAAADLIPYAQGQNLALMLNVTDASGLPADSKTGDGWIVVAESSLQLPLLDYHEEVDLTGLDFADLTISRLDETYKPVNPGETTYFSFVVGNEGSSDATIDWSLILRDDQVSWGRVTPGSSTVPAGGNATVAVRVDVPASAGEGDTAEILLVGTERGTDVPLYGRMTAVVVVDEDIDDEADAAAAAESEAATHTATKNTPVPLWLALAALVAVARRR